MKRTIVIDNGGSELRYVSDLESRKINKLEKEIMKYDTTVPFRIKDGLDKFDVIKVVGAPSDRFKGTYLTGAAFYLYDGEVITMVNQNVKSDSISWYINMILAIAKDAMNFKLKEDSKEVEDGSVQLDTSLIDYSLITLIPVHEFLGDVDHVSKLKSNLAGTYEIQFPLMSEGCGMIKFTLKEDDIKVTPEGVVAALSLRKVLKKNDYSLIIDMGHNTTDICICKGTIPLNKGAISSKFAGDILLKLMASLIRNHGVTTSNQDMLIATLNSGVMTVGNKMINIYEEVQAQKEFFVKNYIQDLVMECIQLCGLDASSINYVIPVGFILGSKNSKTGEYDILKRIIEGADLSNSDIKIIDGDLRYLNINKTIDLALTLKD